MNQLSLTVDEMHAVRAASSQLSTVSRPTSMHIPIKSVRAFREVNLGRRENALRHCQDPKLKCRVECLSMPAQAERATLAGKEVSISRRTCSAAGSRISAWVLPTDEERMIARYTSQAIGA
jgi:hypothetical protein